MKQLIGLVILACAFTWTVVASQEPAATKPRPAAPGKKPASADAPFIGTAAMDGLAEVEHGRLATQNASSPGVKQFAQRMVDDHSKAGDELKGLASQKDVTLATKLDRQHRAMQDKLAKLKGAAFDKAYMAHMVTAHLQAVALFQQEAKGGQDPDVKAWAGKTLPTLQEHLKMASSINATVSKAGM
jgi:putative membrane protein